MNHSFNCFADNLAPRQKLGVAAAYRVTRKLGSHKIKCQSVPIIISPMLAAHLLSSFFIVQVVQSCWLFIKHDTNCSRSLLLYTHYCFIE